VLTSDPSTVRCEELAAGLVPPLAVTTALMNAAERAELPDGEASRTIRSGMAAGTRRPLAEFGVDGGWIVIVPTAFIARS
jgi:hypothetical protein